jgi:hypothetical protein
MPHKKNPINCEKIEGMLALVQGYKFAIEKTIQTWEERAINQSCVERVAWPDLFHTVCHSLETIIRVLEKLEVFPDNMLREIANSAGTYAGAAAKNWLTVAGTKYGITAEDAYRIVQLATANVFDTDSESKLLRANPALLAEPGSADEWLEHYDSPIASLRVSIREHIRHALLTPSDRLAATVEEVQVWNDKLCLLFLYEPAESWDDLFKIGRIFVQEEPLFNALLN